GLSEDEKKANQLQIDSILQTIDRVAGSTSFQGKRLLNGSLDYQVNSVATGVTDFKVNGAKLASGSSLAVNAIVTQSAQQAGLFLSAGAAALDLSAASAQFVIEVGGSKGSRELSFSSGTTLNSIRDSINSFTNVTGVSAIVSGTGIRLSSTDFGSSEFTSVRVINAGGLTTGTTGVYDRTDTNFNTNDTSTRKAFNTSAITNGYRQSGQDINATINGVRATASGKTARVNSDFLDTEITFSTTAAQGLGAVSAFTITGGGADFQLAGQVDIAGKVAIGVSNVAIRKLGNSSTGFLNSLASGQTNNVVNGNLENAQKVIAESINQVSSTRGRLGAFQKNTIGATIRSLGVSLENTSAAESSIRDANFAAETAGLTRNQILVQAATNVLGLANQSPQSALSLLRG
ncbi:MAG: flagellin, partial [Phycisphaerales bacterium]|nr:flagellin [Phycisphaerales bacterium]